jgi:hypothetical protein
MPICNLCKKIPLRDLPPLPDDYYAYTNGWEYALIGVESHREATHQTAGFSYWPNAAALRNSALTCDLCSLIFTSVDKVVNLWDNVTEERLAECSTRPQRPTFEMQLWKRSIGDGFWVLTMTEDPRELQLVAAIGFSVREGIYCHKANNNSWLNPYANSSGDPLEPYLAGRPIEEYSGSQVALTRAANWLSECNTHHSCGPTATPFPTRVIDVGEATDQNYVRLCESSGESGRYACLSYCWGSSPKYTTTKKTMESRKKGIRFSDIPKTLQDAIVVIRALGIRYIWIDW